MSDRVFLGQKTRTLDESPEYEPISRVIIHAGDDADGNPITYEAGNTSGRTLDVEIPLILDDAFGETVAENVLNVIQGYAYKPYQAIDAILDPAAEIGDAVSVGEVYSVLADIETTFSPLMTANIGAREDGSIDHEFPYESSEDRKVAREVQALKTSFIVENGRIATEVSNLATNDKGLFDRISIVEQTADKISASVSAAQNKFIIPAGITKYRTGSGSPPTISETNPAEDGEYYLDALTGQMWVVVNQVWTKTGQPLKTTQASLVTLIEQTASGITSTVSQTYQTIEAAGAMEDTLTSQIQQSASGVKTTVAASLGKFAIDPNKIPPGSVVLYGFTRDVNEIQNLYKASDYPGAYYIDETTGAYFLSYNGRWREKTEPLTLVTTQLQTEINTTIEGIKTRVTNVEDGIQTAQSTISQTADAIRAEVMGNMAPQWTAYGSDGMGYYYKGDVVEVDTLQYDQETDTYKPIAVAYYVCTSDHLASLYTQPTSGRGWTTRWEPTNPPSVKSMIDTGLKGISLSFQSSAAPNTVNFTLNSRGAELSGGSFYVANVEADTVAAESMIKSPQMFDSSESLRVTLNGNYPGPGTSLAIKNLNNEYYEFLKIARVGDQTWLNLDGYTMVTYDPNNSKFTCFGTWDFTFASVILPS